MALGNGNVSNQRTNNTNSKNYIPHPVDLSSIELPQELLDLAGAISKNVHEVWAADRMSEGWTFGAVRNDDKHETHCLVPFEELSDEEKAYDWNTAAYTLKLIMSLGFEIKKKQ